MHTHRLTKTGTDKFPKRIGAAREATGQRKIAGEEIAQAIPKDLFHEAYHSARIGIDAPPKKKRMPTEETAGGGI